MFVMLTEKNFLKGVKLNDIAKYNIAYERFPLFEVVCANLAHKVLIQEYVELTEEERTKLESLINKQ